jgi:cellulose synthase/poly-beta-1,6-N-acetylglucosamine synthase-like glycosyltransferase
MNETLEDELTKKRNMLYYNQMLMKERKAHHSSHKVHNKSQKKKKQSFTSQKIDFKDFLFIPEGLATFFYLLYGIGIPYLVGAIFLFFFVAGGNYDNFQLLDLNAFLVIWMIGYEIVAVFSLIWILILYLQYDDEEVYY